MNVSGKIGIVFIYESIINPPYTDSFFYFYQFSIQCVGNYPVFFFYYRMFLYTGHYK